jgi:hypothetical protein
VEKPCGPDCGEFFGAKRLSSSDLAETENGFLAGPQGGRIIRAVLCLLA